MEFMYIFFLRGKRNMWKMFLISAKGKKGRSCCVYAAWRRINPQKNSQLIFFQVVLIFSPPSTSLLSIYINLGQFHVFEGEIKNNYHFTLDYFDNPHLLQLKIKKSPSTRKRRRKITPSSFDTRKWQTKHKNAWRFLSDNKYMMN